MRFIPLFRSDLGFWFQSSIVSGDSRKAFSKKRLLTCPTNFARPSRKQGTSIKTAKWAADSGIFSWHSLHRSVLHPEFYSASNGPSFKPTTLRKWEFGPIYCVSGLFYKKIERLLLYFSMLFDHYSSNVVVIKFW
jgi:hypothetical protein